MITEQSFLTENIKWNINATYLIYGVKLLRYTEWILSYALEMTKMA